MEDFSCLLRKNKIELLSPRKNLNPNIDQCKYYAFHMSLGRPIEVLWKLRDLIYMLMNGGILTGMLSRSIFKSDWRTGIISPWELSRTLC